MHFLPVFELMSDSVMAIQVELHQCPLHQSNLLTQGPIHEIVQEEKRHGVQPTFHNTRLFFAFSKKEMGKFLWDFPISLKPKVAIANFFQKMQRKTWYSILGLDAMPLSLKNLLLRTIEIPIRFFFLLFGSPPFLGLNSSCVT